MVHEEVDMMLTVLRQDGCPEASPLCGEFPERSPGGYDVIVIVGSDYDPVPRAVIASAGSTLMLLILGEESRPRLEGLPEIEFIKSLQLHKTERRKHRNRTGHRYNQLSSQEPGGSKARAFMQRRLRWQPPNLPTRRHYR